MKCLLVFVTASLGDEIEVPTLTGKVKLKIPPETQSGSVFRLGGKGFPKTRKQISGDLLCRISVETPIKLNAVQKQHLRTFQTLLDEDRTNHTPKAQRWFDHITAFFRQKKHILKKTATNNPIIIFETRPNFIL